MMEHVLRFRASHVTSEACDDENIAYVFLRSEAFPQGHYLMISRCLDSRTKSGIFVEYDDQGQVARGGVARCQLGGNSLTLEIEPKAAEALGIPQVRRIDVDFDLAPASLPELRRSLAAIFAESGVYEDRGLE